jgi:hypothetical protein
MKGNFQQRIGKLEARLDQKADTRGFEIVRQMVGRWVAEHEAKDGRSEAPATECSSTIPDSARGRRSGSECRRTPLKKRQRWKM